MHEKSLPVTVTALWNPVAAAGAVLRTVRCLVTGRLWRGIDNRPGTAHAIPPDFIGICVAALPDPAGDDFILDRLQALGIRHVRLDLTYQVPGDHQRRLLGKLLDAGFKICLHLVQPRAEASLMSQPGSAGAAAAERWRVFIDATLGEWGARIECLEIGATCNRKKWSGQSLASFLNAWQIAWHAAKARAIKIIGPNVTDFEPIYNVYLLHAMQRMGCPPDVHTDNLFVERAVEPESFDHKILGRGAAGWLCFNLIRKAQLLQRIGMHYGVPEFYSTHVTWSLRRIARFLDYTEQKQADYLARYFLLAAASGAINRVYWGPLIGQREGLIDEGTDEYPDPPHVTLYNRTPGVLDSYRLRPAFDALAAVTGFLAGVVFTRALTPGPDLEIMEFKTSAGGIQHAVWTTNGRCVAAHACYTPTTLAAAICHDRAGRRLDGVPAVFGESPVYLSWDHATPQTLAHPNPNVWRMAGHAGQSLAVLETDDWAGIYQTHATHGAAIDPQTLLAAGTHAAPPSACQTQNGPLAVNGPEILRARRNRVWRQPAPWHTEENLIIKQFKIPGPGRRLLDYFKPPKAIRSWNGAQELLRRGVPTPMPLAAFQPRPPARHRQGCYICADYQPDCAVRDVFTALAGGQDRFLKLSESDWYDLIAGFLTTMHDRGIWFRDLSAGNLLARRNPTSGLYEFALIDTARARFYPWRLPLRQRLSDLTRICHPLHWPGRRRFLTAYMRRAGRPYRLYMCWPLVCYDLKHILKRVVKPLRRAHRD